jgi:hypothetical protein
MKTALLAAAALFAGVASAAPIDFEGETAGTKANGYVVAGHPGVSFTDTSGGDLIVNNYGGQGLGQRSLAVFNDDASALRIDFAAAQTFLSLSFGNDDSAFLGNVAIFALLEAFDGNTLVGSTTVAANNDDIMNQSISLNVAGGFNNARFTYVNGNNAALNLIEIVDNINSATRIDQPVPAPATLSLVGAALLGLGVARRRKA